jgi:hypothetical protein
MHMPNLAVVLNVFKGHQAGRTQFQISWTSELHLSNDIRAQQARDVGPRGFSSKATVQKHLPFKALSISPLDAN